MDKSSMKDNNFYVVELYQLYIDYYWDEQTMEYTDSIIGIYKYSVNFNTTQSSEAISDYYNFNRIWGYTFSDELFNGNIYNYTLEVEWNTQSGNILFANLYSIDRSLYLLNQSLRKYNQNFGNPFAQPVNVYSNIENGYGIFSSYSYHTDSLTVEIEE